MVTLTNVFLQLPTKVDHHGMTNLSLVLLLNDRNALMETFVTVASRKSI